MHGQIGQHVRVLRAFAGEQEGELTVRSDRIGEEVYSAPVLDAFAAGLLQARPCPVQFALELLAIARDHGQTGSGFHRALGTAAGRSLSLNGGASARADRRCSTSESNFARSAPWSSTTSSRQAGSETCCGGMARPQYPIPRAQRAR